MDRARGHDGGSRQALGLRRRDVWRVPAAVATRCSRQATTSPTSGSAISTRCSDSSRWTTISSASCRNTAVPCPGYRCRGMDEPAACVNSWRVCSPRRPTQHLIRRCAEGARRAPCSRHWPAMKQLRPAVQRHDCSQLADPRRVGGPVRWQRMSLLFSGAGGPATVSPYASAHLAGPPVRQCRRARWTACSRELDLRVADRMR